MNVINTPRRSYCSVDKHYDRDEAFVLRRWSLSPPYAKRVICRCDELLPSRICRVDKADIDSLAEARETKRPAAKNGTFLSFDTLFRF